MVIFNKNALWWSFFNMSNFSDHFPTIVTVWLHDTLFTFSLSLFLLLFFFKFSKSVGVWNYFSLLWGKVILTYSVSALSFSALYKFSHLKLQPNFHLLHFPSLVIVWHGYNVLPLLSAFIKTFATFAQFSSSSSLPLTVLLLLSSLLLSDWYILIDWLTRRGLYLNSSSG